MAPGLRNGPSQTGLQEPGLFPPHVRAEATYRPTVRDATFIHAHSPALQGKSR